ncbi:MAG: choice-of-anchor B family protein [Bacteroidia bacterium]|nr:choice-of-anchor B family protein [Bacteroidia bacterium]
MKKITTLLICFLVGFAVNAQTSMSLLGQVPYPSNLSDVWGYVDGSGNEYAIVGVNDAVSIVDVTDPYNPVQVFSVTGPSTTWRDMKTFGDYAYITNEASGGMMIIDMSSLPGNTNLTVSYYTGSTYPFQSAHNIYIDENGVAYIWGADNGVGGAIMLDVATNPTSPAELGRWDEYYVHDGVVRGDTIWAACINNGFVAAVDVSDKSNPSVVTTFNTPNTFAHNVWFSDDNDYVFTTDEVSDAFITGYDVSDLNNVFETDRIFSALNGTGVIPHNTHYIDGFLVTSYYTDGIHVTDAHRPHNLIKTDGYDTSPNFSGSGFNGAWGAYPWLPSGVVLASDINEGLYVLGPTYTQACYLEGVVTDSITGIPINAANAQITSIGLAEQTNITGDYATGTATPGMYSVQFNKPGYVTKVINGVTLNNGVVTMLDVELVSLPTIALSGSVVDAGGNPIPNASVFLSDPVNGLDYSVTADAGGSFSISNFITGTYDVTAGQWGYITNCSSVNVTGIIPVVITLDNGYYDDFTFDFAWNVVTAAASGDWERGEPDGTTYQGTQANPEVDVNGDCFDQCYVTGNGGGGAGNDDVDNGTTELTSPVFDATSYTDPYVRFYTWFFNDGGFGAINDTMVISLSDGANTVEILRIHAFNTVSASWQLQNLRISDFITPSATMTFIVLASDLPGSGNLVECGLDVFQVTEGSVGIEEPKDLILTAYPNPFENAITFTFDKDNLKANSKLVITDITGKTVFERAISNENAIVVGNELNSGVYLSYIISDSNKSAIIKVIKQ